MALYPHTTDLLALNLCRLLPLIGREPMSPHSILENVQTLLRVSAWAAALDAHPDRAFVRFLLTGIWGGFCINFCFYIDPMLFDDFLVVRPPRLSKCAEALTTLNQACAQLGIPIAEHKHAGPTSCLTFFFIEMDTVAHELRLPADKLARLQSLLQE